MGQAALKLDELIEQAGASVLTAEDARRRASTAAKQALRQLEARVCDALRGNNFRGLPNLAAAVGGEPYYGKLVHTQRAVFNEKQGLAVDRTGRLVFVSASHENYRGERWTCRLVHDEEFKALDFEPIVRTYRELLEDHAARTGRTAENYATVQRLAERLKTLVTDAF